MQTPIFGTRCHSLPATLRRFIIGLAMSVTILPGYADTVTFTDATREHSGSFQIGPVIVSAGDPGTQVATVQGIGLGLADELGSDGEANRQLVYSPGNYFPDSDTGAGTGYTVTVPAGTINSFSLQPVFRISSATGDPMPVPSTLDFDVCVSGAGITPFFHLTASTTPVTFSCASLLPNSLTFSLQSEWSPAQHFLSYRQDHLSEAQTIQFGFSLVTLDVSVVPEPGVYALLGLGFLATRLRKRVSSSV